MIRASKQPVDLDRRHARLEGIDEGVVRLKLELFADRGRRLALQVEKMQELVADEREIGGRAGAAPAHLAFGLGLGQRVGERRIDGAGAQVQAPHLGQIRPLPAVMADLVLRLCQKLWHLGIG